MAALPKLCGVKELRILFSPIGASSNGVREFVSKNYADLRNNNPDVKFMIREADTVAPRIYARYAFGRESFVVLDGASSTEVMDKIRRLGLA